MPAKMIAVVNQKGGVGKSTLSMLLAATLSRREKNFDNTYKVMVVDADRQGTSVRWSSMADDGKPFPAAVVGLSEAGSRVHNEVKKFLHDYDFIIVDCPAAAESEVPRSALLIADLALVPVVPSPPDLWASVGIKRVIRDVSGVNEDLMCRLVLNMCQPKTTITQRVEQVLDEFGIEPCKAKLCSRAAYRKAALNGESVHDLKGRDKDYKSENEIDDLTDEILSLLLKKEGGEE